VVATVLKQHNKISVLYSYFWAIPMRLSFMYRRFGTLCLFHLPSSCEQEEPSSCSQYL